MRKSQRFRLLLSNGYFPAELPPPFCTESLAKFREAVSTSWSNVSQTYPATTYETFTIPHPTGLRRTLAIVNPIAQLPLCKLLSDNWNVISRHLKRKSYSIDVPLISANTDRSIPSPNFALSAQSKSEIFSRYDYALISDISRFYGTLYTHAIPWALHGKSWCKTNLRKAAYRHCLGSYLDTAIRKGQDNQSVGIPIGPDTSRIISEIIGVSIDTIVQRSKKLSSGQAFRQIDDWFIGFDSISDAESAIATLSIACREFELELNAGKTKVQQSSSSIDNPWPEELRRFSVEFRQHNSKQSLDHHFSKSFNYLEEFPQQNVLDFAIKQTWNVHISEEVWPTYEMHLLRSGRASPLAIPSVVQTFSNYHERDYPINEERVMKFIQDVICKNAPLAHHAEVSWALFLAKTLMMKIPRSAAQAVSQMNSSVCALLALDLESNGQIVGNLDKRMWRAHMSPDGLESNMWLLAYEAQVKGWMRSQFGDYVSANLYFGELKRRQVSFYGTQRKVQSIKKVPMFPRPISPGVNMAQSMFGLDW
ncbi:MAG: RNA-directed DNA polymerase [Alphaproteobacteria bacterium]|nr:RNA-directed DNA polymerase [Alphaproteobacteria bacterium]